MKKLADKISTHKRNKQPSQQVFQSLRIRPRGNWPNRFGTALEKWASEVITEPIHTLSLFSGAGGLDIGFHDAGFSIETMIEIDKRFHATLEANSGQGKYFESGQPRRMDIRDFHPPHGMKVDFIIGGPPCQPFSAAARRVAGVKGTTDEQGRLFKEYVRVVKKLSPRGFLFENVLGLTGAEGGKAWKKIRRAFRRAGYHVYFRVLDAADYGVPQHRRRLFIVGTRKKSYRFPRPICGPDSGGNFGYLTAGQAVNGATLTRLDRCARVNGRYGNLLQKIPCGLNYSFYTEKMNHPHPVFAWRSKFFDFLYKADPMAPIRTLTASSGQYTGPFHWENRRFSMSELKRLQTIPDRYEIIGGQRPAREQIGNAVPPQMARILALSILSQIFEIKLPFDLPVWEDNQCVIAKKRKNLRASAYGKKAKAAITRLKQKHRQRRVRSRSYFASLSEDFAWHASSKSKFPLQVHFAPKADEWTFEVSGGAPKHDGGFSIVITPTAKRTWNLGVGRVVLSGTELTEKTFTAAWKAFENELERHQVKADLVQLCGYYTYEPAFRAALKYDKRKVASEQWLTVRAVTAGTGVRSIQTKRRLSKLWGISLGQAQSAAHFLRKLGYEVRNENTNPQIAKDSFLIPYAFPTLNPSSVQLHKSLEKKRDNRKGTGTKMHRTATRLKGSRRHAKHGKLISRARARQKAPRFSGLKPASVASSRAKQANRERDTEHELLLRSQLWRMGLRFRKNVKTLPGKPDIIFPSARVAVFCDGDFWHGRNWRSLRSKITKGTNATYWLAKIKRNRQRDRRVTARLEQDGWHVIRLWESEIKRDAAGAALIVKKFVVNSRKERARLLRKSLG